MTTSIYAVRMKTYYVREAPLPLPRANVVITKANQAAPHLCAALAEMDAGREHFAGLFLDTRHRVIACKAIFSGGAGEAPVYPNTIARDALLLGARAVVLAHNHPSGDLSPSPEDSAVTRRVHAALATIQVRLLDHLIIDPAAGRFRPVDGEEQSC